MFPGVDGFHWTTLHVVFLAVFFTVLGVVFTTVVTALRRARANAAHAERIRWESDFHDLSANERRCRHELTGEVARRECPNAFDCRVCTQHARHAAPPPAAADTFGLTYPSDRLYHRGHTWVQCEPDGTLLIGLDDLGSRLVGEPDEVGLPRPGAKLEANGAAWLMRKNGGEVRVLSPVDGEVIEAGGPRQGWYLKLRPPAIPPDLRHLLRGAEVRAWVSTELDRLQLLLSPSAVGPSLADGGELMKDLSQQNPTANWDQVLGRMFLDP